MIHDIALKLPYWECLGKFHFFSLIYRFTVAIKSGRQSNVRGNEVSKSDAISLDLSHDNFNEEEEVDQNVHVEDVDLLMDEAKTMFSIGTYHENIVNLQGIGYEADFVRGNLSQVI